MKIFAGWRSSLIALGTDPIEVDHYLEPLEEQQGGIEREPDWSTIEDRGEVRVPSGRHIVATRSRPRQAIRPTEP